MSQIPDLVTHLKQLGQKDQRLVALQVQENREAAFAPWPNWVEKRLRENLAEVGAAPAWQHQVKLAQALHQGENAICTSGTGSGKSLAVWVPYLSKLLSNQNATGKISQVRSRPYALYLSPTKALAFDQVHNLTKLCQQSKNQLPVRIATADGDTEPEVKKWARANADVVATNPDFLHYSLLPNHQSWARFLRGLDLIILDETHHYRGVFAAHVALVLRRLMRVARYYGADPQVAFLSATIADPLASAKRFLGNDASVTVIDQDTSAAGRHAVAIWRPRLAPEDYAEASCETSLEQTDRLSTLSEAALLTADLVSAGAQVLTFVRSRAGSEALAQMANQLLTKSGRKEAGKIAAYRGGYLPEERRELERRLRQKELRALATTSALELGIDVSSLDVSITTGWPGTLASLRQQMGRVARAGKDGLSIVVVGDDPIEAHLALHPETLFHPVEANVFDPTNPYVLGPHLCSAASEIPLTDADLEVFELTDQGPLLALEKAGLLVKRPAGWFWNVARQKRPQDLTDLRGTGFELQLVEAETGAVVGTVDSSRADAVVHPDAIYVHQGKVFQVSGRQDNVVFLVPGPAKLRTGATTTTGIRILEEQATCEGQNSPIGWHFGQVEVTKQVISYDLTRLPNSQYLKTVALNLPERTLLTSAAWFTLSPELAKQMLVDEGLLPGTLHAAEHALIGLLPLLATCDRWDLGGLSIASHPQTKLPTVFVYDGTAGGAGFSKYGYLHRHAWTTATLNRLSECGCKTGCPACVVSPKCGNNNEPLYKQGAKDLLEFLAGAPLTYDESATGDNG